MKKIGVQKIRIICRVFSKKSALIVGFQKNSAIFGIEKKKEELFMGYSGYKKKFVGTEYPGADNRGFVPEHRYVAEQKIGRQLRKGEVVHHCDRNRLNNVPENLIVFVDKESHSRYH